MFDNLINEELNVCQLAADKSPNNYHSWTHRIWLLKKLKTLNDQYKINCLYMKEYDFSENWVSKHVSEFSGFHYRQFCIRNIFSIATKSMWKNLNDYIHINLRTSFAHVLLSHFPKDNLVKLSENEILSCSEDDLISVLLVHSYRNCNCNINIFLTCRKFEILFHELICNNELLRFYKFHETLWYHRRFIVHEILSVMYDYVGLLKQNGILMKENCIHCKSGYISEKQAKMVKYDSNHVYSSNLFKILISHESEFIEEMRSIGDNYCERHEKYLKYIEGINN